MPVSRCLRQGEFTEGEDRTKGNLKMRKQSIQTPCWFWKPVHANGPPMRWLAAQKSHDWRVMVLETSKCEVIKTTYIYSPYTKDSHSISKPGLIKDNLLYVYMGICVTVCINISMFVYKHTKVFLKSQYYSHALLKIALTSSQQMELSHLERTHCIHAKGS